MGYKKYLNNVVKKYLNNVVKKYLNNVAKALTKKFEILKIKN